MLERPAFLLRPPVNAGKFERSGAARTKGLQFLVAQALRNFSKWPASLRPGRHVSGRLILAQFVCSVGKTLREWMGKPFPGEPVTHCDFLRLDLFGDRTHWSEGPHIFTWLCI